MGNMELRMLNVELESVVFIHFLSLHQVHQNSRLNGDFCWRWRAPDGAKYAKFFLYIHFLRGVLGGCREKHYNPLTILTMPFLRDFSLKFINNPNFRPVSFKYVRSCFLWIPLLNPKKQNTNNKQITPSGVSGETII